MISPSGDFDVQEIGRTARDRQEPAGLTNLHSDLDYDELRGKLPPHVEPAFDGMRIELRSEGSTGNE
jgi:phosphoribosyl 1,2-cyclic phosphate phosphodiesterase